MYVERIGQGQPLVLIHGWAMHGGVFSPLVERLSSTFELHVVDLPGHGHSRDDGRLDLDDCARRIAEMTPSAAWLGWSLGGLVALTGALKHPDSVTSLVMLSATPRFVAGDDWPDGVRPSLFTSFADGLRRDYRGTLEQFLALEAFGSDHLRDELRALKQQLFARGEPDSDVLETGLRLLADAQKAEEACQETFIKVWQQLHRFRGDSSFSTWLHSIATRTAIDLLRKERKLHLVDTSEVDDYADSPAPEPCEDLEKAIASLPARARAVFVLFALEGYTHPEISKLLGIAEGSSKAHYHRARQLLQERFRE